MMASPIHCAECSQIIRERDDDVVLIRRNRSGTRFYHTACSQVAESAAVQSRGVWRAAYRPAFADDVSDDQKGEKGDAA